MKIISALKSGFSKVIKSIKILPIIYIVNICMAMLLAIPMFSSLKNETEMQGVRDSLSTGFDYEWWDEFNFSAKGIEETLQPTLVGGFGPILENLELLLTGEFTRLGLLIFLAALLYISISSFFAGGALAIYEDEKRKYSIGRFFSHSAVYFNRFFSLTLTSIILFVIIYKILHPALFNLVDYITANFMSERSAYFVNFLGYMVILIVILFINLLLDYAKIVVVVEKRESAWEAVWWALKFIFKHFGKVSGLYLLVGIIGLSVAALFALILSTFTPSTVIILIIAILIQQVYILAKMGIRLCFYACQLDMYTQGKVLVRRLPKA